MISKRYASSFLRIGKWIFYTEYCIESQIHAARVELLKKYAKQLRALKQSTLTTTKHEELLTGPSIVHLWCRRCHCTEILRQCNGEGSFQKVNKTLQVVNRKLPVVRLIRPERKLPKVKQLLKEEVK